MEFQLFVKGIVIFVFLIPTVTLIKSIFYFPGIQCGDQRPVYDHQSKAFLGGQRDEVYEYAGDGALSLDDSEQ